MSSKLINNPDGADFQAQAVQLIESFKKQLSKAAEEVIGPLFVYFQIFPDISG